MTFQSHTAASGGQQWVGVGAETQQVGEVYLVQLTYDFVFQLPRGQGMSWGRPFQWHHPLAWN